MNSFELTRLDSATFEHLVNMLALRVLGPGSTGFGPGPDGGRDGWFEGEANYPSSADRWTGVWYIQSKFHAPHLSSNSQKWLLSEIEGELDRFSQPRSDRQWPDNWIIASNIDPTGKPETGSFDAARAKVRARNENLAKRFHIWGGQKIIGLLAAHPDIAQYYAELVTPGHVISSIYQSIVSENPSANDIIRNLVVTRFDDFQYTKLDQAGSDADNRPGIQKLYTDLPYVSRAVRRTGMVAVDLAKTSALKHNKDVGLFTGRQWSVWNQEPARSRAWFIKGGPGQGKSTSTQFLSQIHRAAIILSSGGPRVTPKQRELAESVRKRALCDGVWPLIPRLPINVELREYAQWLGSRKPSQSRRMIVYLAETIAQGIGQKVGVGLLKDLLKNQRWLFIFDGLDEVPGDVKDSVANEVAHLSNDLLIGVQCDGLIVCTSRPQGYSGQFDAIDHATIELSKLSPSQALQCARPVLEIGRSASEIAASTKALKDAISNPTVREIMTTPLQSHIMAVVVRGGGKPPERKWQLFNNFYEVIKRREAARILPNPKLSEILLGGDKVLKSIHARLGFELHTRAENSAGATTSLTKDEFRHIVSEVVCNLQDDDVDETVATVMEATTERLVLVNTPESGDLVRFDIRPLQEFFAAEYLYEAGDSSSLGERLFLLARDSHWREVLHFYLSALVENGRKAELAVAIEALNRVNVEAYGDASRALSLRLALGSLQAARLLAEGVLEQDKRVRADFRRTLDPIGGTTDIAYFVPQNMPPRSRSWLINMLFEIIEEANENEAVGAFIALSFLLEDSDPRTEIYGKLFANLQPVSRRIIVRALSVRFGPWKSDEVLPSWLWSLLVSYLATDNWSDLEGELPNTFGLVAGDGRRPLTATSTKFELSDDALELIVVMFGGNRRFRSADRKRTAQSSIGGLAYRTTFVSDIAMMARENGGRALDEIESLGGLFQGCSLLIRQGANDDPELAKAFCEWAGNTAVVQKMPYPLNGYLHSRVWATMNPVPFTLDFLERDQPGSENQVAFRSVPDEHPDWPFVFRSYGYIGRHVVMYPDSSGNEAIPKSLANFLRSDGGLEVFRIFVQTGVLDDSLGSAFAFLERYNVGDRCREVLIDRLPSSSAALGSVSRGTQFSVALPKEIALLPLVLVYGLTQEFDDLGRAGVRQERSPTASALGGFGLDVARLIPFAREDCDDDIHAAALVVCAMHASDAEVTEWVDAALARKVGDKPDWFVCGLLASLGPMIIAGEQSAWSQASELLRLTRDKIQVRQFIEPLLKRWRERTGAPVQNSMHQHRWH